MHRHRRPHFLDDAAALGLEGALKTANRFPAERIVESDRGDRAVAKRPIGVLAERVVRLAAGPAGADDPLAAATLGEVVRRHHRVHRRNLLRIDVRGERVPARREQRPRQQMHAIRFHQLPRLRQRHRWNSLVVFDDELNLAATDAVADLVQQEQEAIEDVAAVLRERARQRHDEADLDRSCRCLTAQEDGCGEYQRQSDRGELNSFHVFPDPRPET